MADRRKQQQGNIEGLDDVRAQLDDVDRRILDALVEREQIVLEVARRKEATGAARVRDPAREEALLSRLVLQGRSAGLDAYYVTRLFREVIDHSVRVQEDFLRERPSETSDGVEALVIAYQGVDGAYSQLAAARHFGPRGAHVVFRGYPSFGQMMEAVRDGNANYGMLPVENTTAGSINEAYDLLARMDLVVVGEEVHKVEHCLVAIEPIAAQRIRRVYSHPQALAQCSEFLAQLPNCHVESFADTAMAVQKVGEDNDLSQAAVASEEAARNYGLTVIKKGIANQRENYTRFMVVSRAPEPIDARVACKTSLLLATKHEDGALLGCLSVLAARHLNLTKLESRPRPRTPWEYVFYIDFEGNAADDTVKEALAELRQHTSFLRVLGSYPSRAGELAPAVAHVPAVVATGEAVGAPRPTTVTPSPEAMEQLPHRLASRRAHPRDTVVKVGTISVGGDAPVVFVSAPAHLEGAGLKAWTAAQAGTGVSGLRLRWGASSAADIENIARSTGLALVVDVEHPEEVEPASARADGLVAPAGQMQNVALLHELGRVDRPVWIERSVLASLDEWLAAAEYVLERGNHRVVLLDRGVRSFDQSLHGALDLTVVSAVRERCHLPVLVDPCAAAGHGRWAEGLSAAAVFAGAHGVSFCVDPSGSDTTAVGAEGLQKVLAQLRPGGA